MNYLGDRRLSDIVDLKFLTTTSAGVPSAFAASPAPVISVYKDNSVTESTAGVTLTSPFDSRTGMHHVRITTATDATFYSAGSDFMVVITTGTVNAVSVVGTIIAEFSIENRSAVMPTTATRKLDVSAGGEAGVDWANVGSPTTTLDLSGTTIKTSQVVASVTGAVGSVTGAVGSVTGAVGSVTGNVGGNVVGSVASVVGAVGSVTGNVGGNVVGTVASVVGAVGSVTGAVGSVTGAVGSVGGNVTGSVGSLAAQAKADVNAEVVDALNVDTYAEPGQEAPGATVSLAKKLSYLYKAFRNRKTQTSTTLSLYADDATTVDQKATISDDATTYTHGEIASGP